MSWKQSAKKIASVNIYCKYIKGVLHMHSKQLKAGLALESTGPDMSSVKPVACRVYLNNQE
jgi:hypothetical protein